MHHHLLPAWLGVTHLQCPRKIDEPVYLSVLVNALLPDLQPAPLSEPFFSQHYLASIPEKYNAPNVSAVQQ